MSSVVDNSNDAFESFDDIQLSDSGTAKSRLKSRLSKRNDSLESSKSAASEVSSKKKKSVNSEAPLINDDTLTSFDDFSVLEESSNQAKLSSSRMARVSVDPLASITKSDDSDSKIDTRPVFEKDEDESFASFDLDDDDVQIPDGKRDVTRTRVSVESADGFDFIDEIQMPST